MTLSPQEVDRASAWIHNALLSGALTTADIARVVAFYQEHNAGLVVDGEPGPKTLALLNKSPGVAPLMAAPLVAMPPNMIDRRRFAAQAHGPRRDWKVTDRTWAQTTGICWHQTACLFGENPSRGDGMGAHFWITRAGVIIWLHDLNRVVQAANAWSNGTVSVEVDGNFAGVHGRPETVWNDPDTAGIDVDMVATEAQLAAMKVLARFVRDVIAANGGRLNAGVAHRQSSKDRPADPGSRVWGCAIEINTELGLTDGGPGFEIGGYPICVEWDQSRTGYRY